MFMVRQDQRWRFFVIPRLELERIRKRYVAEPRVGGPGPKPKSDADAKTDSVTLKITFSGEPTGWNTSLAKFESTWPEELPELADGPGRVRGAR